ERLKKTQALARIPLVDVVGQWRNLKYVLLAAGALLAIGTAFYIYITFSISYATTVLKIPSSLILNGTQVGSVVMFIVLPLAGALSDRFGRLPIYLIGAVLTVLTAFPIFWLIDTKSPTLIALALSLGLGAVALMYGPLAAFYSEMFDPRV